MNMQKNLKELIADEAGQEGSGHRAGTEMPGAQQGTGHEISCLCAKRGPCLALFLRSLLLWRLWRSRARVRVRVLFVRRDLRSSCAAVVARLLLRGLAERERELELVELS